MPNARTPLVVSFYTLHTPYQVEVRNLIASCEKWGIEHRVEGVKSMGSWELNCAYKAFFLREMLAALQRPLLWVDADAVFLRPIAPLPQFAADLATRIEDALPLDHPSKVISGTLFVNATAAAMELLSLWTHECARALLDAKRELEFWDQVALRDAIFHRSHRARVESLPLEYTKIFGHINDLRYVSEPVIEHFQASRRYKRLIT